MSEHETSAPKGNILPFDDQINIVTSDHVWRWLAAGWADYRRAAMVSIPYGLMFVVAGFLLTVGLYLAGMVYLIVPMTAGFMLAGPLLTVGLYEVSRQLGRGEKANLWGALMAWRANPRNIIGMGLAVVLFLVVWMRVAIGIFALSFPYQTLSLESLVTQALTTFDGFVFLSIGTVVGAGFATIAFVAGAVSLPMMLDRRADIISAVVCSAVAVHRNARTMALWAALIVIFTVAGLLTGYVGLIVTLPLIGHASWHAYRDLIRQPQ